VIGHQAAGRAARKTGGCDHERRRREDGSRESLVRTRYRHHAGSTRPVTTPCAARPSRSEAKLLLIQAIARKL